MNYENLIVYHNNEPTVMLNPSLITKQKCEHNIDKIKALHEERLELRDMMAQTDSCDDILMIYNALYTEIEFELQDAWGFGRDIKFHKFWDRPHCACAKMDNEDNYPSGFYYFLSGCTLHG